MPEKIAEFWYDDKGLPGRTIQLQKIQGKGKVTLVGKRKKPKIVTS